MEPKDYIAIGAALIALVAAGISFASLYFTALRGANLQLVLGKNLLVTYEKNAASCG
jgi:hypothetical protein